MTITNSPSAAAAEHTGPQAAIGAQAPRAGRAQRRTFTTEFKRAIVAEYDAAPTGTKGAVLRRERLYDSHVNEWRQAIQAGTLDTLNRLRFCAAVIRAATCGFGLRSRLPRSVLVAPSLGYRGDGGYCTNQPIPRWRIPRLRWTDTDRNGTPWCRCIRLYTVR